MAAVWGRISAPAVLLLLGIGLPAAVAADDRSYTSDQIQAGYHLYTGQCQLCHGANGDGIAGVNLARQQFPIAVSDGDIRRVISTGNPAGMPPFVLKGNELDELVAFVRSGLDPEGKSFRLGEAARGKAVYAKAGCADCHRIGGVGSLIAPDLTDIGFLRRPSQIVTSLTDPDEATMPINRTVTIVMRDGRTIKGRRFDEDTFSVQLIDSQGQLMSIPKSEIGRYGIGMTSEMPSYRGKLTGDEIADLLAYLISLKG